MNRVSMQPIQTVVSQLESSFEAGLSYSASFLQHKVYTVALAILGGMLIGEIISRVIKAVHFPLFDRNGESAFPLSAGGERERSLELSNSSSSTSQQIDVDEYMKQFVFPTPYQLVDKALLNSQGRLNRFSDEAPLRPLAEEILQKVRDGHRNRIVHSKKEAIKLDLERGYHRELLDQLVRQGIIHSWHQLIFDYQSYVMVKLQEEDSPRWYRENDYRNFDDTMDRRNGWRTRELIEAEQNYHQGHHIHLDPSHLQLLNVAAAEEIQRLVAELNTRVKPGPCEVLGYSFLILKYLESQRVIYRFEPVGLHPTHYTIFVKVSDCKGNSQDPE